MNTENTDKKKQLTQERENMPPIKARKKHIVLFVIACVLLAGTLLCLYGFADPAILSKPSEPAEPQLPGGSFLIGLLLVLAAYYVMGGFAFCWCGGQVISVLLAMDRKNKPKWLWVASLVLVLVYLACILVMLGLWFLT